MVSRVLNNAGVEGGGWDAMWVWLVCLTRSQYVDISSVFKTYAGFLLWIGLVGVIVFIMTYN
jgi:hypothetical protein